MSAPPKRLTPTKKPNRAGTYEVGYGKPPKDHRFQPGKSGNPKGRPKGSKNKKPNPESSLAAQILKVTGQKITVQGPDGSELMSMTVAALKSLAIKAVKGDHRSQKLLFDQIERAELIVRNSKEDPLAKIIEEISDSSHDLPSKKRKHCEEL